MSVADTMVAVIEDDPGIRDLVTDLLRREGFEVLAYADAASFFRSAPVERLDCLILDVMLPGEDGLSICRTLRAARPRLPILMVSAKGDDVDRIVGLEVGADDYLAKPFNARELLARVRAALRRLRAGSEAAAGEEAAIYRFAGWTLSAGNRSLTAPDGALVNLTGGEFDLLLALVSHPQRVVTRDQLLDWTRGKVATPFDRAVDVQLSRLRRKIGDDPREPAMIRTIRGDGYMFAMPVARC
ncbi:two-component system, OmpR family, response regulator [Sphingomonas sp. OV641]|jgi:two-component system OmpR family response regulator|uniref:Regulatory protein VirG n=2 Tax=Sphingomonas TaxID=13687 RepID=A0A7W7AMP5_9SPHN|nr:MULTISPECIES: response regulator [Sphingomonas]MBB4619825.1 two-component system OmpR family response regulator [Sphingomonas abaci]NJR80643.1 response regulator [Sphingomonas corticis]RSV16194.1 response regulator [Sphingomonas sp. ABOLG]SEJ98112.1 two-component system, OmpR family, response regulator [Sphingomonas sp. OV641]